MSLRSIISADWHIALNKKKIPNEWQINRFKMFFDKIFELEKQCDIHIIAGDIFDRKPSLEESALFADFANKASIRTIIIPGNHEASSKGKTFFQTYLEHEKAINNTNIEIYVKNTRIEHKGVHFQLFPYNEMQIDNLPIHVRDNDILVTHIRGNVPPHIKAEYDFKKLRPWKLILLGDLHFAHSYENFPAYYPGSPLNVVFDREENRKYGLYILDYQNYTEFAITFKDLKLPKLIRKTIKVGEPMISDSYNHIVYEVTGSVDELSTIQNHELLDKKIAHRPLQNSVLNLTSKTSIREELEAWLQYSKIENVENILQEFDSTNIS